MIRANRGVAFHMHAFEEVDHIGTPDHGAGQLGLELAGVRIDAMSRAQVLALVQSRLEAPHSRFAPLAIGSVNLDHIHHFGVRRAAPGAAHRFDGALDWRMLIDGAPVAHRARVVTGRTWPRLTGADLLPDLLAVAAACGARVGFLGGHEDTVPALRARLARSWPSLVVAGVWTPPRPVVTDPGRSRQLARSIHDAGVDLLVIGLGKPRQERWAETYGGATGAAVLTMFGAAADFLAGSATRAPVWMQRAGCEWAFRLLQEPHRLWRRYLVQGPRALRALRASAPVPDVRILAAQTERTKDASPADITSLVKR